MKYTFIDNKGTFTVKDPHLNTVYFPLTDRSGSLLSAINPRLSGDIKKDNDHFLTIPASIEDIRNNPMCRREFFVNVDGTILRLSQPCDDTLEAGLLYHTLTKRTEKLTIEITNFIPYDLGVEIMSVKLTNHSTQNVCATATSCIPLYGRSEKNLRDHRHVSSLLNRIELSDYSIILTPSMIFDEKGHTLNSTHYFALAYQDQALAPAGQYPTLDYFCGTGDMESPDAITKNTVPVTGMRPEFDGKEVCAAFRYQNKVLQPGENTTCIVILGLTEQKNEIKKIFSLLNTIEKIRQKLNDTRSYWLNSLSQITFDFKDPDYNNWLMWVRLQPTLRKLFGCSFLPHFDYGKGGRGWRDLWQDALTLLLTEPAKAKTLIMRSFEGVRIDGSNATIIGTHGDFIADRNKINRVWMDHGVWPYLALASYIHKSGDIGILLKEVTYFRDRQIKRATTIDQNFVQNDFILRGGTSIYKGSILEHVLIQNLVQFFNVGDHNVVRLENADWNDGLDMAAKNGESVAFSFMYAHNMQDLCVFLEALKKKTRYVALCEEIKHLLDSISQPVDYDKYKEKQKRLQFYLEKTKKISGKKIHIPLDQLIADLRSKSSHLFAWINKKEWLTQGYFNGYYDNKKQRVEGKIGSHLRMLLPSQVFAIMSGGATHAQIKSIYQAIEKSLKDKDLGGYRLNTDFKKPYLDLGRAFGFSYGDKENGAFFSHMVVMLAFALYKQGFVLEGQKVLRSIYQMSKDIRAQMYPGIPEYFNGQGRGLYLYLTGSASWYYYTLLKQVIGIDFYLGNLIINPKLTSSDFAHSTITVRMDSQNKIIEVTLHNKGTGTHALQVDKLFIQDTPIQKEGQFFIIGKSLIGKQRDQIIRIDAFLK